MASYYEATSECMEWLERNRHVEPDDLIMAWNRAYRQAVENWGAADFVEPTDLLNMTELLVMWFDKYGPSRLAGEYRHFANVLRARLNPYSAETESATNPERLTQEITSELKSLMHQAAIVMSPDSKNDDVRWSADL